MEFIIIVTQNNVFISHVVCLHYDDNKFHSISSHDLIEYSGVENPFLRATLYVSVLWKGPMETHFISTPQNSTRGHRG